MTPVISTVEIDGARNVEALLTRGPRIRPADGKRPGGIRQAGPVIVNCMATTRSGTSWVECAGVARVQVTPTEPIFMKGYGSRTKPSEGVRQDLHVKALALQDETGATSVLVTSDLHSYTRRMSDTIAEAVQKTRAAARSVDPQRLAYAQRARGDRGILASSLRGHQRRAGSGDPPLHRPALDQIVDLIGRAIADLAPADLAFGQGSAAIGVNRRRLQNGTRHLPGVVDQDVPVLTVRASGGALRAVVFGYACHATAAPADYQIGGDWPGYAQAGIETDFPGATAMFVNGCSADCDPAPRSTVEAPKMHGDLMAVAVGQVVRRQMRPVSGPITTAFDYVDIPFQTPPTRHELEAVLKTATGMRARHAKLLLGVLDREGRILRPLSVSGGGLEVRLGRF